MIMLQKLLLRINAATYFENKRRYSSRLARQQILKGLILIFLTKFVLDFKVDRLGRLMVQDGLLVTEKREGEGGLDDSAPPPPPD